MATSMTTAQRIKRELRFMRYFSYEEVERFLHEGRISQAGFEAWCYFWEWSAARMSGIAGDQQYAYAMRHGRDALYARFERTNRAFRHAIQ